MKKLLMLLSLCVASFAFAEDVDVVAPSNLSKKPEVLKTVAPTGVTPSLKGMVVVEVIIGKDGKVIDAKIKKSTLPDAEPACLEAIRLWQFKPGEREGAPVATRINVPFRFGSDE
jgi:TonB family protein